MKQESINFHPSAAETANGNSGPFAIYGEFAAFYVEVTAASGTSPTLNVLIDEHDPVGDVWHTVATFGQLSNPGNDRQAVTQLPGVNYRARWVIGGTTPSFTFTVSAEAKGP